MKINYNVMNCLKKYPEEMEDCDFAFANEIMVFVNKENGHEAEFRKYRTHAEKSGNENLR